MTDVQKRLLAGLAVLVLLAGVWKLLLEPANTDRTAAQQELTTAQGAESSAQTALDAARTAERDVERNRQVLVTLSRVVPAEPETSALLDRLDDLARRSDVSFDSLDLAGGAQGAAPTADAAGGATASAGATEIPVSLKLSGTFPRVTALLRRLHGRGADLGGGRLLKLSSVTLAEEGDASGGSGRRLTADITAVAFTLPEEGASAAPATTPGSSAPSTDGAAAGTSTATAPGGTG